jgi:hypothetical protein
MSPADFKLLISYDKDSSYDFDKLGPYGKWLVNMYRKQPFNIKDMYTISYIFDKFNALKAKKQFRGNNDINQYKSIKDFMSDVDAHTEENSKSNNDLKRDAMENEVKTVYDDGRWSIKIPLTLNASSILGKGTRWCTTGSQAYELYNRRGQLYIFFDKQNNRKFQMHKNDGEMADEQDFPVTVLDFDVQNPQSVLPCFRAMGIDMDFITFNDKWGLVRPKTDESFRFLVGPDSEDDEYEDCKYILLDREYTETYIVGHNGTIMNTDGTPLQKNKLPTIPPEISNLIGLKNENTIYGIRIEEEKGYSEIIAETLYLHVTLSNFIKMMKEDETNVKNIRINDFDDEKNFISFSKEADDSNEVVLSIDAKKLVKNYRCSRFGDAVNNKEEKIKLPQHCHFISDFVKDYVKQIKVNIQPETDKEKVDVLKTGQYKDLVIIDGDLNKIIEGTTRSAVEKYLKSK